MSQNLHLQAWQSFKCHSCGRCCRNTWDIRVEPAARQGILESQAARRCERNGYTPLVVLRDGTQATGRRPDGACVFLDDNELCQIHGELGPQRKPLACQLYPYSLTATPDGYFASLSFACPSVVAGLGGDLEDNRKELLQLLQRRGSTQQLSHAEQPSQAPQLPHEVTLWPEKTIAWPAYLELEQHLLRHFDAHDPVTSLLDLAVGLVKSPTNPQLVSRDDPFEESVLAMICASVIALWELPDAPEQRQALSQAVLTGEPQPSARHGIQLPPFDFGPTPSPFLVPIFERYFQNAVIGKSLLAGPVLQRLLALACGYALVMYYGDAFRQAQKAAEWNLPSLSRAFELVESDLVTHTASADGLFAMFEATLRQAHEEES